MDIIEELQNYKRNLGLTNEMIAKGSGIPLPTVQKILGGVTRSPRRKTLLALESYFRHYYRYDVRDAGGASQVSEAAPPYGIGASQVGETAPPYGIGDNEAGSDEENDIGWIIKKEPVIDYTKEPEEGEESKLIFTRQGTYTLDDFYALPDGIRCELIDGVLYEFNAPSLQHQNVIGRIYNQIIPCADNHGCMVFVSPVDVQLDRDDRTMIEPDIAVLCDRDKAVVGRCIYGAPDFVLEVPSPSTRKRDFTIKVAKYQHAGCKEYWIVDLVNETVYTYYFEDSNIFYHYTFNDKVPVRISGGKCDVDFNKIRKSLAWFRK